MIIDTNTDFHNTSYQVGFIAANADVDIIAPIDYVYAGTSNRTANITNTNDGVHHVMFNAVRNTTANAKAMSFQEGITIGSTLNLDVTPTTGSITLSSIGDYIPNGGSPVASSVTLNAGAAR